MEIGNNSKTLKSYSSGVKNILEGGGIFIAENSYKLSTLTRACKIKNYRLHVRLPIHKSLLNIMLDKIYDYFLDRGQGYLSMLYQAILAKGYYGLLRVGELTSGTHLIKAYNVHVGRLKNKFKIVLESSKRHSRWPTLENLTHRSWWLPKPTNSEILTLSFSDSKAVCYSQG